MDPLTTVLSTRSARSKSCLARFKQRVQQHEFCPNGRISCGLRLGQNSCRFRTEKLGGGVFAHPRVCAARSRASNRRREDPLERSFALPPRVFGSGRGRRVLRRWRWRVGTHGLKPGACVGCFPVYAGVPVEMRTEFLSIPDRPAWRGRACASTGLRREVASFESVPRSPLGALERLAPARVWRTGFGAPRS